jgi:hypothetical protein
MTLRLSSEQRRAIEEHGGTPVYVTDPDSDRNYVLLRAEQYETLKAGTGDVEADDFYPLLAEITPEDWEDASCYDVEKS